MKYQLLIFPSLSTLINQSLLCLKIVDFFLYIELSPLSNKNHQQKYRSFKETFFQKQKSLKVHVLFFMLNLNIKTHEILFKTRKLFLNTDRRD